MSVRAADGGDAERVALFQTAVWREAYAGLVPQAYLDRVGAAERLERWSGRFATGSRKVALAEDGGAVVGVVSWAPAEAADVAPVELKSLYVAATHRGTGLAARLMATALGARPAYLWVFAANPRARAFYARHGFAADGGSAVDPDTGLDEVRLVRRRAGRAVSGRRPTSPRRRRWSGP